MAREYVVSSGGLTLAGAVTLAFVRPSTTMALEILRIWASLGTNSASAQQRISVEIQSGTAPVFLTGITPAKLKQGDAVSTTIVSGTIGAAGTASVNASTEAGTKAPIWQDAFNVLNGYLWVPTPRETIILPAGGSGLGIFFPVAPSILTSWSAGIVFAELG